MTLIVKQVLVKKKVVQNFAYIKINPTLNNVFITLTDRTGNVLASKHAGILAFKSSKKRTPYIATLVMKDLFSEIKRLDIDIKSYIIKSHGVIRNGVIKNVLRNMISITNFKNVIYLEYSYIRAHNGLRRKKRRRL